MENQTSEAEAGGIDRRTSNLQRRQCFSSKKKAARQPPRPESSEINDDADNHGGSGQKLQPTPLTSVQPTDEPPSINLHKEILEIEHLVRDINEFPEISTPSAAQTLETVGEKKALTRDLSPLWGLAASLFLAATLFGVTLISAPPYELRQMADQKVWNGLGVTRLRQLISDWTNGSWPINNASDMQSNDQIEIIEHISPQRIEHSELAPTEIAETAQ